MQSTNYIYVFILKHLQVIGLLLLFLNKVLNLAEAFG